MDPGPTTKRQRCRPKDQRPAHNHKISPRHPRRAGPPLPTIARRAPACAHWTCQNAERIRATHNNQNIGAAVEAKKRPQMREQCPGAKQPGHPRVALRDLTQNAKQRVSAHSHPSPSETGYKQAPALHDIKSLHPPTPPSGTAKKPRGTPPPLHHPPGTTGPLSTNAAEQRAP